MRTCSSNLDNKLVNRRVFEPPEVVCRPERCSRKLQIREAQGHSRCRFIRSARCPISFSTLCPIWLGAIVSLWRMYRMVGLNTVQAPARGPYGIKGRYLLRISSQWIINWRFSRSSWRVAGTREQRRDSRAGDIVGHKQGQRARLDATRDHSHPRVRR